MSWKPRRYLPEAFNEEDTPVLCKIVSDTSQLNIDRFEKVGNIFRTAYLVAKYKVKVNIEVADILFEVWCQGMKLSQDQRIRVQWMEGAEVPRPLNAGRARDELSR